MQRTREAECGCVVRLRNPDNELSGWLWSRCKFHRDVMQALGMSGSWMTME
jgi:hypothetical protein